MQYNTPQISELKLIPGLLFFSLLYNALTTQLGNKKARNITSAIHAYFITLSIPYCFYYQEAIYFEYVKIISCSYFTYDSLCIILLDSKRITRICLLYHHIVAIYILYIDSNIYNFWPSFFVGELSNLPTYTLYHLLHSIKP